MANNLPVKTGTAGVDPYVKTTDDGGVHTPHHNVDAIAAGEVHIGEVSTPVALVEITLSLDTVPYADGDVLADTQEIANAVRVNGGAAILQSVTVIDENDQGVGMDLVFLNAASSMGSENSAPSISDANARNIIGRVTVTVDDYIDLGGCSVAAVNGLGAVLQAAAGSRSLYVAAITRFGTPTYSASGIRLKIGLLQG